MAKGGTDRYWSLPPFAMSDDSSVDYREGISQGVAQIGLAAVVVQEVIRVEVIAQLQVAEVDVEKSTSDRSVSPKELSVPSPPKPKFG